MESEKYREGQNVVDKIFGEKGKNVLDNVAAISPDLRDMIVGFAYGEVYTRKGLDLKTREMTTITALTAMGNAPAQLKVHLHGALEIGCRPEEIIEIMIHLAIYAGFPAALNGMMAAKEVFEERGIQLGNKKQEG